VTYDGKRLQMIVCSATLHSFDVKKMAVSFSTFVIHVFIYFINQEKLMHFPTWIDLKGQDSVPETVHHVVSVVLSFMICLLQLALDVFPGPSCGSPQGHELEEPQTAHPNGWSACGGPAQPQY
jgi:hypothetical protein